MHSYTHQVIKLMCACFLSVLAVGCGDSAEQQGATATPDTSADISRRAGECSKDTDCDDGELCLASKCVNPNSSGGDGTDGADGQTDSDAVDGLASTDGATTSTDSTDDGSDSADGASTSADGADSEDGGGGSTSGQGSGSSCETSADCPGDEFCCDVGFGGYCESEASACYGPECSGDDECGEGRECCPAQAALPAYCAPIGGCYGPTCANDGDCGSGQECCPIDFVDDICGPVGQCIGNLCASDGDCDGDAECCAIEAFGQAFSVCLLGSLCALAQNAAGGGDGGDGSIGGDGNIGGDGSDGGDASDGSDASDGGGSVTEYSCDGVCGEFQQGWPCQCTQFCQFVPGGCCEDYEAVCDGSDGGDGGDSNDGDDGGAVSGCQSSDECGSFAVCCPQGDGSNACQTFCPCESGADCVDLGCCITNFGSACTPQNLCFGGTFDPAAP